MLVVIQVIFAININSSSNENKPTWNIINEHIKIKLENNISLNMIKVEYFDTIYSINMERVEQLVE